MKNETYLQITAILFFLVIIGLTVGLILMSRGSEERESARTAAETRANQLEKEKGELTQQVMTLKSLIGHQDAASMDEIQKAHNDAMARFVKDRNVDARNYRIALNNLGEQLFRTDEEHKKTQDTLEELRANFQNLKDLYQSVVQQNEDEKRKAVDDLMAERKRFGETNASQQEKFEALDAAKRKGEDEALAKIEAANTEAQKATERAKVLQDIKDGLTVMLDDIRRTNFDRPNGKILSVNQQSGIVVVNLGSDDGLMTRMTFSVYAPSITGISFGVNDPEKEAVICEVCKREQSLNASKASIEIIRIMGPHKAEARILDDLLTDPIVAGDVIYTPVWKPGQRQHFALGAGMRIPGVGKRDGGERQNDLTELMQLIRANGGVVDCYISEGTEEHPRGEIVGKINRDTTFMVVGDLDEKDNLDQPMMEAQADLIQMANDNAVRKIGLRDFLSRMGWKNVTPVRGFGTMTAESDLAIPPTGEHRPSTGIVSPLYQSDNDQARITIQDRTGRASTGTVTGLFSDSPSRAQSTGQTSELFRPRKPATSQAELTNP